MSGRLFHEIFNMLFTRIKEDKREGHAWGGFMRERCVAIAEHTAWLLSAALRHPQTVHKSSTMAADRVMPIADILVSRCKTRLHIQANSFSEFMYPQNIAVLYPSLSDKKEHGVEVTCGQSLKARRCSDACLCPQ